MGGALAGESASRRVSGGSPARVVAQRRGTGLVAADVSHRLRRIMGRHRAVTAVAAGPVAVTVPVPRGAMALPAGLAVA